MGGWMRRIRMDCQRRQQRPRRRVDNAGAMVRCLSGSLQRTKAHVYYRDLFGIHAI